MRPLHLTLLFSAVLAGAALAQDDAPNAVPGGAVEARLPGKPAHVSSVRRASKGQQKGLLAAIRLPLAANGLRTAGYSAEEVKTALAAMRSRGLSGQQGTELFERATEYAQVGRRVAHFGTVVEGALASGMRGRDLGLALRAASGLEVGEHAERRAPKGKSGRKAGRARGAGKARKLGDK